MASRLTRRLAPWLLLTPAGCVLPDYEIDPSLTPVSGDEQPAGGTGGMTGSGGATDTGGTTDSGGAPANAGGTTTSGGGTPATGGMPNYPNWWVQSEFAEYGWGESGPWSGYAFTFVGEHGSTISPDCELGQDPPASCYSQAGPHLCAEGNTAATYEALGAIGWSINQERDAGNVGPMPQPWNTTGQGVSLEVANLTGHPMRVQITDGTTVWCADLTGQVTVLAWEDFETNCWDGTGDEFTPGDPITEIHVHHPSSSQTEKTSFRFCVIDIEYVP